MWGMVCETVPCPSSIGLWARHAGDIDQMLQQRRVAGECGQCHVVSVRRSLNIDLLLIVSVRLVRTISNTETIYTFLLEFLCYFYLFSRMNCYSRVSATPVNHGKISWNSKLLLEVLEISWNLVDAPGNFYNSHRNLRTSGDF